MSFSWPFPVTSLDLRLFAFFCLQPTEEKQLKSSFLSILLLRKHHPSFQHSPSPCFYFFNPKSDISLPTIAWLRNLGKWLLGKRSSGFSIIYVLIVIALSPTHRSVLQESGLGVFRGKWQTRASLLLPWSVCSWGQSAVCTTLVTLPCDSFEVRFLFSHSSLLASCCS